MGADLPRLYAVPLDACGFNAAKVCWGSCGQGIVGGINLEKYGEAIPCSVPAAQCPHFEREMAEPYGTVDDGRNPERPVYLRKLTAEPHEIRIPLAIKLRAFSKAFRWWRFMRSMRNAWRYFFPLPPECRECGQDCHAHRELPPIDKDTLLDRAGFYGSRLRVSMVGSDVLVVINEYGCDGSSGDQIALLQSDAEALRDALDIALERMK
jgi:hypothetical protein